MNRELILLAAAACKNAYKDNVDLGHAEYALTEVEYKGEVLQILAMPGSNETVDWFWNVHLWSTDGVKRCTYKAVNAIHDHLLNTISYLKPLLVVGHSKAGPDALYWKKEFGAEYCVAFCPPPAFRRWSKPKLDNTVIVTDPDDIVHKLGMISFTQPEVSEVIELPNDHKGWDLEDHSMESVEDSLKEMFK